MSVRLDPRAKLFLLLLGNLTLFLHISLYAEILLMALFLSLFFLAGKIGTGVRLTVFYAVLVLIDIFVVPVAEGFALTLLSLASNGIRMLLPCIVSGAYAFSTTTAGEMVCGLRKLHVPETIIIPCVVVIRFFPTIREDYLQIRSAMAFRGIAVGNAAVLRHPMQSLEYILIPLLMNGNNVAQDLSVAALTKGISLPGEHTSMVQLKMSAFDWLYMILCMIPFGLFLGGVL